MRDNLEKLTDSLNIELINIRVSEELKLKTLEKCRRNEKVFIHKALMPITCTIAACLLMGIIIYPIYNKNNLVKNEQVIMNKSDKNIQAIDKPSKDLAIINNEGNTMEEKSIKIKSKEIVEESEKEANKSSKEKDEIIVLNENTDIAFKIKDSVDSEKKNEDALASSQSNITTINKGIMSSYGNSKDASSVGLPEEKQYDFTSKEEINMKNISLQEARRIFGESINIPAYVPLDFVIEKILVPEVQNGSSKLYEVVYSNDSQYFILSEYKNVHETNDLDSKVTEESEMIVNINKIPVKYTISESIDKNELPYTKLIWDDGARSYAVEGNAPWGELVNIISSIIK